MAEPPTKRQRRHLNYDKCQFCRKAKKACKPVEREWPQKCQRCVELELECSENSRAPGAPESIPPQLSDQALQIEVRCDLSLRAMWLGRLNFYHKSANAVWGAQEKLFRGWRDDVGLSEKQKLVRFESISYYEELSNKMICSDDLLAVFMAHTLVESTPLQHVSPFPSSRTMVDRSRANGDVSTALAMQELMLLHHPKPTSTDSLAYMEMLSIYCDLFQETTERLETTLGRKVPAVPPLHYHFQLTKHKQLTREDFSRFIFMKDYYERSLLHVALDLGLTFSEEYLSLLQPLSSAGDAWGRRPIHIACTRESRSVMDSILDITADCDIEDCLGRSALHYASSCGNEHAVRQLLRQGAKVGHQDHEGRTPSSWAFEHGHMSIVEILRRSGADGLQISAPLPNPTSNGYADVIGGLFEHEADVNLEPGLSNATTLHLAARHGDEGGIDLLLRNGSKVNERDIGGYTALHLAANHGHYGAVELLLRSGADVNKETPAADTALLLAVRNNNRHIVEILLSNAARVHERNDYGESALSLAVDLGYVDIVGMIFRSSNAYEKNKQSGIALCLAVKKRRVDIVQELLKNGAGVNETDQIGQTPLLVAVDKEDVDIFEVLFRNGADIEKRNRYGETPLLRAVGVGNVRIVQKLLRNGARVDKKNLGGETALMKATAQGNTAIAQELLKHGAAVGLMNSNGRTALPVGCLDSQFRTVEVLPESGAGLGEQTHSFDIEKRGITHSRGGLPVSTKTKGHENQQNYPSSWGFDNGQMTMKKRVLTVFDRPSYLAKDDHKVRVNLSDGKYYVTDLDVNTM